MFLWFEKRPLIRRKRFILKRPRRQRQTKKWKTMCNTHLDERDERSHSLMKRRRISNQSMWFIWGWCAAYVRNQLLLPSPMLVQFLSYYHAVVSASPNETLKTTRIVLNLFKWPRNKQTNNTLTWCAEKRCLVKRLQNRKKILFFYTNFNSISSHLKWLN